MGLYAGIDLHSTSNYLGILDSEKGDVREILTFALQLDRREECHVKHE
mgnify:CR=1 FL=1